ncbi:ribosome maturation factor RimP [Xylocopilactobacillus apicola]|uniref:Ribosome maturation factor RimP n=1 Tax=Xylocopilactobacillus apicola TaxID=2932184 RepID=A0AAU9CWI1_9LACO|nr:hypothetical protein [Xylocopilactobacillus apicola]BDR58342.1 ribosome maturation factor RimP [Xylocopilactobacillus apicola]
MNELKDKVKEIVNHILLDLESSLQIYEINYYRGRDSMVLQVLLQKNQPIGLDELIEVNQLLSEALDQIDDQFSEPYTLDVASAGLEREIKDKDDLHQALNSDIKVNCYRKFNDKKIYLGKLNSFDDQEILVEQRDGKSIKIPFEYISKINYALIM